jgi:hypothetical protein
MRGMLPYDSEAPEKLESLLEAAAEKLEFLLDGAVR